MDPPDVVDGDEIGLELVDPLDVEKALLEDLILGVKEPFLPLGVVGADGPVKGREKDQSGFMRGTRHGIAPCGGRLQETAVSVSFRATDSKP